MVKFEFDKEYILENGRTRLSPLGLDHIESLRSISDDSSIWTYFLENGQGAENLSKYIQAAVENRKERREYPFVVYDKKSNAYAGMTRLYEWNEDLRTLKLGHTWYGTQFQGTGLNKHCKYLLFEFAFEQLEAFRIGFGVHGENARSLNALASVGCKKEGTLRDFLWKVDGQARTDLILLSILKREWQETIKETLRLKIIH